MSYPVQPAYGQMTAYPGYAPAMPAGYGLPTNAPTMTPDAWVSSQPAYVVPQPVQPAATSGFGALFASIGAWFRRVFGGQSQAPVAAPLPTYAVPQPVQQPTIPAGAPAYNWGQPIPTPAAQPVAAPATVPAQQPAVRSDMSVGPVPLEGYDFNKLQDLSHRTVKYVFGRIASHYPLDAVHDKASAQALLERMLPEMRAAGLEVVGVNNDCIQVKTEIGYEWVDVVRGAGAPNPGWWWGSEGQGTPTPTQR